MARFIQFGDSHVRDLETYHPIPTNQCSLYKLANTRGLYVAVLDAPVSGVEVLLRIDTVWTAMLREGGLKRKRNIVIEYEGDECVPPQDMTDDPTPIKILTSHVVALQIGFDPIFYADGLPLFR